MAIKSSVEVDDSTVQEAIYPDDTLALVPFAYTDYMLAIQSQKVCYSRRGTILEVTGQQQTGENWQVPFVRCDGRKCQYLGQDAQPFCEYSFLAVAGSTDDDTGGMERAKQLQEYIYKKWPFLLNVQNGRDNPGRPFPFEFVQIFRDSDAMDDYVKRNDYGTDGVPKIGMGIVFDGNDPNHYKYWLRQNSTNMNVPGGETTNHRLVLTTPPTDRNFNNFARNDFETCMLDRDAPKFGDFQNSCTGLYIYNGVIATQRLVGDFILNQTGAGDAGFSVADGGVSYVQFPQQEYIDDGFFRLFEGKYLYKMLITHKH